MSYRLKYPQPPTPKNRADWAAAGVKEYNRRVESDSEDVLVDFLADLMHWADVNGYNFNLNLKRAKTHYEIEVADAFPK